MTISCWGWTDRSSTVLTYRLTKHGSYHDEPTYRVPEHTLDRLTAAGIKPTLTTTKPMIQSPTSPKLSVERRLSPPTLHPNKIVLLGRSPALSPSRVSTTSRRRSCLRSEVLRGELTLLRKRVSSEILHEDNKPKSTSYLWR